MRHLAIAAFALVTSIFAVPVSPAMADYAHSYGHGYVKTRLLCNDRGQCARAPYMYPESVRVLSPDYYGPYPRYYNSGRLMGYNFGIGGWYYYD